MKSLSILIAILFSISANASQTWTVSSQNKSETSPIPFNKVERKVLSAVKAYKAFEKDLGEVKSWTCEVVADTQPNSYAAVTKCSVALDLPSDWCYYGSFKLELGFDRSNGSVITLKYEWVKDEI